ncbi:MAG TPA: outer membrane protein transport protein [Bacteroidales bacterium]|nr:outer membrane protein transport protein [Bacteroidales bacterium]
MKKTVLTAIALLLIGTTATFAQMDNLSNMSAKWVCSNTRNAATDEADIVNYNPAGLVRLVDGFHINLSNQTMFRKPEHSFALPNNPSKVYKFGQDGVDPFLPMFYAAYKHNKWALASGVYISGGGATANYPDGSFNTTLLGAMYLGASTPGHYQSIVDQYLKASSFYLTVPLIFSYSLNDKLSIAAGGRFIKGMNKTEAGITLGDSEYGTVVPDYSATVKYKEDATGFGGVIGIFYQPTEKLALSVHYETGVKLDFETKDNEGTMALAADGTKKRRDLPATLCTGASYKATDKLTVAADFNYFFQTSADWGKIQSPRDGKYYESSEAAGDCYTAGLGFAYDVTPKLQLNLGTKYTAFLYDDQKLYYTKMGLYEVVKYNNLNIGIGGSYKINERFQVDLGAGRTFWNDKTINSIAAYPTEIPVKITDKGYVIAVGLDITL